MDWEVKLSAEQRTEWSELKKKYTVYMEAGLALLLVLTLGLAGMTGKIPGKDRKEAAEEAARITEEGETQQESENPAGAGGEEKYPIMGSSEVTAAEMKEYFESSGKPYPAEALAKGGAETIETFCQIYCEEAEAEGVRAEVAFAQTMKETGFLQYGGDASVEQFNFAGIGTTGGGVPGNFYPDVRTGIRAQIQHLKAYATSDRLVRECVDNRYEYVKKGSAPYVEWLGQKENPQGTGWATGENYGYDIVEMIAAMKGNGGGS